jgi:uncharacterized membrane protein YdjX (TVP38/TMEM64 family)
MIKSLLFKYIKYIVIGVVALALALAWVYTPLSDYTRSENLTGLLDGMRENPFSLFWIIGLYILAALLFFPVTVLSSAVILLYGGELGFIYATIGGVCGALVGYGVGRWIGLKRLRKNFSKVDKTAHAVRDSGVIGMTIIRMIPLAPFSVVNMVLGAISVPLSSFIFGTMLGMAPGKIVLALFDETIISVFQNPSLQKIAMAICILILWMGAVCLCNKLARKWQKKHVERAERV